MKTFQNRQRASLFPRRLLIKKIKHCLRLLKIYPDLLINNETLTTMHSRKIVSETEYQFQNNQH